MESPINDNPYQSPAECEDGGGDREDMRRVAVYQRLIICCILAQLPPVVVMTSFRAHEVMPMARAELLHRAAFIFLWGAAIVGLVLAVLLTTKVYNVVAGALLIPFMFSPYIGFLALLGVNGLATSILRRNGYRVGLLGAKLSQFDRPPTE